MKREKQMREDTLNKSGIVSSVSNRTVLTSLLLHRLYAFYLFSSSELESDELDSASPSSTLSSSLSSSPSGGVSGVRLTASASPSSSVDESEVMAGSLAHLMKA